MDRIKIAIICGHFLPDLGYLETDLARGLSALGHDVHIITSDAVPEYVAHQTKLKVQTGKSTYEGYTVHRLKVIFSFGQIVLSRGLYEYLGDIEPDLALVIGLGKRFPEPILQAERTWGLFSFVGDNTKSYKRKQNIVDRVVKNPVYEKAVKTSDLIYSYTPESKEIVEHKLSGDLVPLLEAKSKEISLGFDEEIFHFSAQLRSDIREKHGYSEHDLIAMSSTRCSPEKDIDDLLNQVNEAIAQGAIHTYHFFGLGDDEYSKSIINLHSNLSHKEQIQLHETVSQAELNTFFQMADVAIWPRAGISVFQAIGTGLLAILPEERALSHIPTDFKTGYTELSSMLSSGRASISQRIARADKAKKTYGLRELCATIIHDYKAL